MKKEIIIATVFFLILALGVVAQEANQAQVTSDSSINSTCGNGICEDGEELIVCKDPPRNCDEDCMNSGQYGCKPRCAGDCGDDDDEDSDDQDDDSQGIGQTIRNRVKAGVYTNEEGEEIKVSELAKNRVKLKIKETEVESELEIEEETMKNKTKLKVKLSNGRNAEIKIMPDTASERALEKLRLKVCSEENSCKIELKEVGEGEESELVYEFQAEKQGRFLGLFKMKMKVQSQVNAENGEVIKSKKPWWAFLVAEE